MKHSLQDEAGSPSQRSIEPLGVACYLRHWTLVAFCQLRQDYRAFRVDRLVGLQATSLHFEVRADKCLAHYLAQETERYDVHWYN